METEKPVPLPLTGEEVQEAVLVKVKEAMQKSCHLRLSDAYTSFKAKITVELVLSDYGREVRSNHVAEESQDSGLPGENEPNVSVSHTDMDPEPPNQVRIESGQPVPVKQTIDGKSVIKNVRYAARKGK